MKIVEVIKKLPFYGICLDLKDTFIIKTIFYNEKAI